MAQTYNVVIAVLPSAAEVREVVFGWDGLARGFAGSGVLIDMGSSDPIATKRLTEELSACGINMMNAPALGTAEDEGRQAQLCRLRPGCGRRAMPADLRDAGSEFCVPPESVPHGIASPRNAGLGGQASGTPQSPVLEGTERPSIGCASLLDDHLPVLRRVRRASVVMLLGSDGLLSRGRYRIEFALALLDSTGADMALYRDADMVRAIART
jgi:NAD binding domain of 6-phosphogluconate dehydrogenase